MSKTNSLHYKLCCEGAKWMRKQEWGIYRIVTVELCTLNIENPDVWGTSGFKSMLIEVKTSRADIEGCPDYGISVAILVSTDKIDRADLELPYENQSIDEIEMIAASFYEWCENNFNN